MADPNTFHRIQSSDVSQTWIDGTGTCFVGCRCQAGVNDEELSEVVDTILGALDEASPSDPRPLLVAPLTVDCALDTADPSARQIHWTTWAEIGVARILTPLSV